MNTRILGLTAAAAMVLSAATALAPSPAQAFVVTEVGGGAAGITVAITRPLLPTEFDPTGYNAETRTTVVSRVVLPAGGSATPIYDSANTSSPVPGVSVESVAVQTEGNLNGTPFAESSTSLNGVHVPGTDLYAIRTHCVWERSPNGYEPALAETTIYDQYYNPTNPSPNTAVLIPGWGTAILNEQTLETLSNGSQVISVIGLHLVQSSGRTKTDVKLGFSSCDPLKLPSITGVTRGYVF